MYIYLYILRSVPDFQAIFWYEFWILCYRIWNLFPLALCSEAERNAPKMKKILLLAIVFLTIISLFLVSEAIMVKKNIVMHSTMRFVFGIAFMVISLSTVLYLICGKFFKYVIPDYILTSIIEIIGLAILVFVISIILLLKK